MQASAPTSAPSLNWAVCPVPMTPRNAPAESSTQTVPTIRMAASTLQAHSSHVTRVAPTTERACFRSPRPQPERALRRVLTDFSLCSSSQRRQSTPPQLPSSVGIFPRPADIKRVNLSGLMFRAAHRPSGRSHPSLRSTRLWRSLHQVPVHSSIRAPPIAIASSSSDGTPTLWKLCGNIPGFRRGAKFERTTLALAVSTARALLHDFAVIMPSHIFIGFSSCLMCRRTHSTPLAWGSGPLAFRGPPLSYRLDGRVAAVPGRLLYLRPASAPTVLFDDKHDPNTPKRKDDQERLSKDSNTNFQNPHPTLASGGRSLVSTRTWLLSWPTWPTRSRAWTAVQFSLRSVLTPGPTCATRRPSLVKFRGTTIHVSCARHSPGAHHGPCRHQPWISALIP